MKNILHSFLKGFSKYKYLTILIKMMWTIAFFFKTPTCILISRMHKKTYFWNICSQIWKLSLSSINPIPTYVWFTQNRRGGGVTVIPPLFQLAYDKCLKRYFQTLFLAKLRYSALLPYWVLRNFGKQILIKRLIKCVNRMN